MKCFRPNCLWLQEATQDDSARVPEADHLSNAIRGECLENALRTDAPFTVGPFQWSL